MGKTYLHTNVLEAAKARIQEVYNNFEQDEIIVSFSGGKDSTAMLNIILDIAKKNKKTPVKVLHIDFEAQYDYTIKTIDHYMNLPEVEPIWVCLPLFYRNSLSPNPFWICWDPEKKNQWVREKPTSSKIITEKNNIFENYNYYYGMKPSQFYNCVSKYIKRTSKRGKCAQFVGIRADESLNRFRAIKNAKNRYFGNKILEKCSTKKSIKEEIYNFYPIYDFQTADIWKCLYDYNADYNKTYDAMFKIGVTPDAQRICQPFGDEQKAGLNQYAQIEGTTWNKVVKRVGGANFGNIYCKTYATGHNKIFKPDELNWKEYFLFLLNTLPPKLKSHYQEYYIIVISNWLKDKKIKNENDIKKNEEKIIKGDPSYKRFCKMILKNDFIGHEFSFSGRKNQYRKTFERSEEDIKFIEEKFNFIFITEEISNINFKKEVYDKWRKLI